MAKPWARIEQNYINHQKFLVLGPAAICLWLEGKNYCDMQHTDGLIPRAALKTFRFATRSAVEALCASAGPRASGEPWTPLWEVCGTLGFKMHDYLDYNDCRDEVLARIEDADDIKTIRKQQNTERQRRHRANRKVALQSHDVTRDSERDITRLSPPPTETETPTETRKTVQRASPTAPIALAWDGEAFMEQFRAGWKRLYGYETSLFLKPEQFTALQQQLSAVPEARLRAALAAYFETTEPFVLNAKHPLMLFLRDPLRFLAVPLEVRVADGSVDRVRAILKEGA